MTQATGRGSEALGRGARRRRRARQRRVELAPHGERRGDHDDAGSGRPGQRALAGAPRRRRAAAIVPGEVARQAGGAGGQQTGERLRRGAQRLDGRAAAGIGEGGERAEGVRRRGRQRRRDDEVDLAPVVVGQQPPAEACRRRDRAGIGAGRGRDIDRDHVATKARRDGLDRQRRRQPGVQEQGLVEEHRGSGAGPAQALLDQRAEIAPLGQRRAALGIGRGDRERQRQVRDAAAAAGGVDVRAQPVAAAQRAGRREAIGEAQALSQSSSATRSTVSGS